MGEVVRTATRAATAVGTGGLSELERTRGNQSFFRGIENTMGQGANDFIRDLTGQGAADAAGMAAMAQLQAARENRQQIMDAYGRLETDSMRLAQASPQELRAYEQSLAAGEKQLASEERLMASIDPALLEASSQVLSLLRKQSGQRGPESDSADADALEAQRRQQRQALVDSLREQYGPGAESSSLGLKALRDFDIASSAQLATQKQQLTQGAQQMRLADQTFGLQQLQGLGGIMGQYAGMRPDALRTGANLTGLAGTFQNRQLNTRLGLGQTQLAALAGANAPMIQSAGAPFVAEQARAQGVTSLYGNLTNATIQGGIKAFTGGAGGK